MASAGMSAGVSAADLFKRASRLLDERDVGQAVTLFGEAEELGYSPDECGGGRWFCHMLTGDFESAWKESERIASRGGHDANRLWTGRPVDGRDVVIRCLHGLGDAIQFVRFVPVLRPRVNKLYVEVPGCLVRLFETVPGIDEVFTWDAPPACPPAWDEQVEVMELARLCGATLDTLPAEVPYLFPLQSKAPLRSKASLKSRSPGKMRAGVVWASSDWNPARSIPLSELTPVLADRRFDFYSLQQGNREAECEIVAQDLIPAAVISDGDDVLDTAQVVQELDLVITVDTMAAHLAGALGKPVWLLLTERADWRWLLGRPDSPWYPTMRILRQGSDRSWKPLVEQAAGMLNGYFPGNGTQPRVI